MNDHNGTTPLQAQSRNGRHVSQRGMLSLVMLVVSMGALGSAGLGGVKVIYDVLSEGSDVGFGVVLAQVIVIGMAFFVGWLTAIVAIRVYGNLILPILIKWCTWICLAAICFLYISILLRMYNQPDDIWRFFKYLFVMAGGLAALVGLHLIIEDHDLRPFSVPLLIISLMQLGMIVIRYVFDVKDLNPAFLWKDLVFLLMMVMVSVSMLAHLGILEPFRTRLTNYFDRNSVAIRTQD